ncbi:PINIT domain-containing protein, partial [Phakopsora pachyrhizi]
TKIFYQIQRLRTILPTLKVDNLKAVLREINLSFYRSAYAKLSGRKDELISRIDVALQEAISQNSSKNYEIIRSSIYRNSREMFSPFASSSSKHSANNSGTHQSLPPYRPSAQSSTLRQQPTQSSTLPTPSSDEPHRALAPTYDFGPTPLAHFANTDPHPLKLDPVFGTHTKPGNLRSPFVGLPRNSIPSNCPKLCTPPSVRPSNCSSNWNNQLNSTNNNLSNCPKLVPGSDIYQPVTFSVLDPKVIPIQFEKSPFYRVDSSVSLIAVCHVASPADRKSVSISITLSPEQRQKLLQPSSQSGTQFQLRMFSTSENFFNHPSFSPASPVQPPALTEFPYTADIRLNSQNLTTNVRGIKKQPGTAQPPDIGLIPDRNGTGKALDLREGAPNRLDIVYSNAEKRYYCVVYLVEYFNINSILKNLKANSHRTDEQVLAEIKEASTDEDVITSSSVISLNDPVVMSRIQIPIRSLKCSHLQCFDAEMFYMMMESTPTWLCPVCNLKLKNEDITIDDYFATILKQVPKSIDSVTVESDGTWHDDSYKHGTSKPKAGSRSIYSVGSGTGSSPSVSERREFDGSADRSTRSDEQSNNSKKRSVTVLEVEESDEDDEDLEEGNRHKRRKNLAEHCNEPLVIDLTLDDD